ncbi:MAG TPA: helix-turn-helix transcriptional regulator [Pirellulales bacterium]|nr:helix-turn-helix transcriptional regulator [Pirellulales bacterium]
MRRLIRDAGVTVYVIARETKIDNATLSRFLSGERGLSHKALDRLGEYLQIELTAHGPKRSK